MSLIILKLGGSLITKKAAARPTLARARLKRMCQEIAAARPNPKGLILVHGAGSYGHPAVKRSRIDKGIGKCIEKGVKNKKKLAALAEVQRLQNELNVEVCRELQAAGVPAFPIQASASAHMRQGRLLSMDILTIKRCLKLGLVPVLYGTPAFDTAQGCSILSGDQIIAFLAERFWPHRVICVTAVDGVFDRDPGAPGARLLPRLDRKMFEQIRSNSIAGGNNGNDGNDGGNSNGSNNGGGNCNDVTGGMFGKVEEMLRADIRCEIISGRSGNVLKALRGETGLGTAVIP